MMTKKGLLISHSLLESAGLGDEVEVFTRDHTIIVKSKSMTDRVRGIVKKSPLTVEIWMKYTILPKVYSVTQRIYRRKTHIY
jgi:hypothetical protein